jgi:hypothetical protein
VIHLNKVQYSSTKWIMSLLCYYQKSDGQICFQVSFPCLVAIYLLHPLHIFNAALNLHGY